MTIQENFDRFDGAHPEVYNILVKFAREAKKRGLRKFGIAMLYERARWWSEIETDAEEDYKLCNDYRALYARKLAAQEPDLADVFRFRSLRSVRK